MSIYRFLAWFTLSILIGLPLVATLLISTTTGSQWLLNRGLEFAPIEISYDKLDGRLLDEVTISNVRIDTGSLAVESSMVQLSWKPWRLFNQQLEINVLRFGDITIITSDEQSADASSTTLPQVNTPLAVYLERIEVKSLSLANQDNQKPLILINELKGHLSFVEDKLTIHDFSFENSQAVADSQIKLSGSLISNESYPLSLQVETETNVSDQALQAYVEQLSTNLKIRGDLSSLTLEGDIKTSPIASQIAIETELDDLLTEPRWQVSLSSNELDTERLQEQLLGDIESPFDGRMVLNTIDINAAGTLSQLQADAIIQLNLAGDELEITSVLEQTELSNLTSAPVNLNAKWQKLNVGNLLELPEAFERLISENGKLIIDGSLDNFEVKFDQKINANQFSINQVLRGKGSTDNFTIERLELEDIDKLVSLDLSGDINWRENLFAAVQLHKLQLNDDDASLDADGAIQLQDDQLKFDALHLYSRHEDNLDITVNGSISTDLDSPSAQLRSDMAIADLGYLRNFDLISSMLPEAIRNDLSGRIIANIQVTNDAETFVSDVNFKASEIVINAQEVQELNINAKAQISDELVTVELTEFDFDEEIIGRWTLAETTTISTRFPITTAETEQFCLNGRGRSNPQLCLSLSAIDASNQQLVSVTLKNVSIPSLLPLSDDSATRVLGQVSADAKITWDVENTELISADGQLNTRNVAIVALDEEYGSRFKTLEAQWSTKNDNRDIHLTGLIEPDEANGKLATSMTISDWRDTPIIDGKIDIDFNSLAILQLIEPQLTFEESSIKGLIQLNGPIENPNIDGQLDIKAAQLGFAQMGLSLYDVTLSAKDIDSGEATLNISGQASSGEGSLELNGQISPFEPSFEFMIQGEDFTAIESPRLFVSVSPDLKANFNGDELNIQGSLRVPDALIQQPDISNVTSASPDVRVFENGERIDNIQSTPLKTRANIRIELGDNVEVDAFGFNGFLTGALSVAVEGERNPRATGTVSVKEGDYEIYGQELTISRGSLVYTGGVIENPGLDLRVTRNFSGSGLNDDVEVGAQVGGTLMLPRLSLFSNPAMPDSQILSYLVLGQGPAAEQKTGSLELQAALMLGAQGVDFIGEELKGIFAFDEVGIDSQANASETSFYVGKYLSPDLYVKYGVGLLEPINTFFVRYRLTDTWQLESTSSNEAQGGDIIYTIETD